MRETVLARASKLDAEGAGLVEAIESTDPVAARMSRWPWNLRRRSRCDDYAVTSVTASSVAVGMAV